MLSKGVGIDDNSIYDGVICRTVSGWKHSSTKATFTGVVSLRGRYRILKKYCYSPIGSGTVFIKFKECL